MSDSPQTPPGDAEERPTDATVTNLDAAQRLEVGEVVAGRYRIEQLLGLGAMGIVYRAHDEELDLEVAIKVLRPELANDADLIERFRRELLLARQVSHGNVVRIHDLGKDEDLLFITMDFVAGRSLRQILESDGAFEPERAAAICGQLARALAAAHEKGIVHRDLKPSNVMIDDEGNAFITDFGVARSIHGGGLTGTGIVVGTPDYLAPEQYRGEEVDGRCDLYALGVVLFEMLAGRRPFSEGTAAESMAQRMTGLPTRLPALADAPNNLRHIIRRCLEPDRNRRYPSAEELAADLDELRRPKRLLPSRRRLAAAAAVTAILAVAGVVAWRLASPDVRLDDGAELVSLPSLAVLPFTDQTERSELGWLARGVPELMFEGLVAQGSVRMADPQRVSQALTDLKLVPASMTASDLARASALFDADHLLVGSVRTDGATLRLDARLIDSGADPDPKPLSVEVPLGAGAPSQAVRALQEATLEALTIRVAVTPEVRLDSEALPEYAQAARLLRQGDTLGARTLLEEATAIDPDFGPALLRLSQAYEALGLDTAALETADRAVVALGPGSGRLALVARAQEARLAGDPKQSLELLKELVQRYPTDLEASVQLADTYGAAGRFEDALEQLEAIVDEAPNHPQAWFLRAKYSILSGASRQAVDDYLVRAMVIQNKLRNRQGQADVLNAFGVAYRQLGELDQAEQSYQRAAELRRELGDERGYATTLRNLAQIAISRGRFDEAERNLLEARAKLEELGDEGGMGDLYNELGMMEEARGRYAESLEFFRQALQLRRRIGDQSTIAQSLNNIGFASHELGRVDDAAVYWGQALDLFNQTGNQQGMVSVRQSLGQLQKTQGQWAQANESYLEALELSRELEWTPAIAASLGFLGMVAHNQGRYAAALAYHDEALELFRSIEDDRGVLEFGLARLAVLLDLGELEAAQSELDRLEPLLDQVGSDDQRAESLRLTAGLEAARGEGAAAERTLALAAESIGDGGSRAVRLRIELARAERASDISELRRLFDVAEDLGDVKLTLDSGAALLAAELGAGNIEAARRIYAAVERRLRAVDEYADGHRIAELRGDLAAVSGEEEEPWRRKAREEIERIGRGLTAGQVLFLSETQPLAA